MKLQWVVWAFAGVAASACESDSGPPTVDGGLMLVVNPGALSINIAGQESVAVEVGRSAGLTGTVSLSVSGAPTGVVTAFDADSLPDGTNTTNLRLTVDSTASAGTSTLTVTAAGGTHSQTATLQLTLATITVNGRAYTGGFGTTVGIVGKPVIQTTTDFTFDFTFTDVKIPYDLYVMGAGGPDSAPIPAITYYKGLTRVDPRVSRPTPYCTAGTGPPACVTNTFNRSTTVSGTRSGAGTDAGPTYLRFKSPLGSGEEIDVDGSWSFTFSWYQTVGTTSNADLLGLQAVRGALGAPTGWYYGETATTITSGTPATVNLTLATVTTANLTGTITSPSGFPMPTVSLMQLLAPGGPFEVWTATTTNGACTIPLLPNAQAPAAASFYAKSTSSGAVTEGVVGGIAAATDVTMALPAPAELLAPADNAASVSLSTPFAFNTTANQVYVVTLESSSGIYLIYTTSGSITIPDVPEMPLPSSTSFDWKVLGYGPLQTIDSVAGTGAPPRLVSKFEFFGPLHTLTTSPTRGFTTQ